MKKVFLTIGIIAVIGIGFHATRSLSVEQAPQPQAKEVTTPEQLRSISVIKTGVSFGECLGYCEQELSLTSEGMTFTKEGHDLNRQTNLMMELPRKDVNFPLTTSEWDAIVLLVNLEVFNALPERIGCPGCADGGVEWIEISDGTTTKRISFEVRSSVSAEMYPLIESSKMKIIQKGDKMLRGIAKMVPIKAIKTAKIQKVLTDMQEAMHSQEDAVAIAAPQIAVPLRIFIVSGKVFTERNEEGKIEEGQDIEPDMIFINPEIIKRSKKTAWLEEGCLSVRWWYGEVKRSRNVTIRAYDGNGMEFTRGAGGLLAHIFQHETDHLEGILFDDKARDLREVLPEDLEEKTG